METRPEFAPTIPLMPHSLPQFSGLDLLSSAVLLVDGAGRMVYVNPAAEHLFATGARTLIGQPLSAAFDFGRSLQTAVDNAMSNDWSYTGQNIEIVACSGQVLHLNCTVTPLMPSSGARLIIEFQPISQQLAASREERQIEQQKANRELIRNLAHEIKNPLGGIRGAAQLLEHELADSDKSAGLREYTQVIIKESDRLQDLMQRLLTPQRAMQPDTVNIHEILERVRSLMTAEYPGTLVVRRDYDTSLPELVGDREQLIQSMLNIARNAAQAMQGRGEIRFRTRALRQVTLAKRNYRLALEVQIIDNGPGIPEEIRERIFYPLVSGREGGSGLGLTIAQNFIQHHQGSIECSSHPGYTCFTVRLPLPPYGQSADDS